MASRRLILCDVPATPFPDPMDGDVGVPKCHALPEIVRAFKTFSARRINAIDGVAGCRVWQRSFHDRIIRDDCEWAAIRRYIHDNPQNWRG